MIEIVGAKGEIENIDQFLKDVDNFGKSHKIVISVLNADMIYGKNHLISAVNHAVRSIDQKTNTTNTLGMEILLYASGERQLKNAIPKMGVKKGKTNVAFVFTKGKMSDRIIDELLSQLNFIRKDAVLKGNIDTLKKFGIRKKEIDTISKDKLGNLILEKVAKVDIIK